MPKCFFCDAETSLFEGGRPICVECADLKDAGKPPKKRPPAKQTADAEPDQTKATGSE